MTKTLHNYRWEIAGLIVAIAVGITLLVTLTGATRTFADKDLGLRFDYPRDYGHVVLTPELVGEGWRITGSFKKYPFLQFAVTSASYERPENRSESFFDATVDMNLSDETITVASGQQATVVRGAQEFGFGKIIAPQIGYVLAHPSDLMDSVVFWGMTNESVSDYDAVVSSVQMSQF